MEERPGEHIPSDASDRESRVIDTFRGRIAGLRKFHAMEFVGLAWAGSADPGEAPYERYIDALYRRSASPTGYADAAVRTWLRAPLSREEFSVEPYLATHVHDFMFERKGGEFDFDYGISEIVEAMASPGRLAGTLAVGGVIASQNSVRDIVTVVGYAECLANGMDITFELEDIPRIRR